MIDLNRLYELPEIPNEPGATHEAHGEPLIDVLHLPDCLSHQDKDCSCGLDDHRARKQRRASFDMRLWC